MHEPSHGFQKLQKLFLEVLITSCLFLALREMKCWQYTWSKHTACQCYYVAVKHGHYRPVINTGQMLLGITGSTEFLMGFGKKAYNLCCVIVTLVP